MIAPFPKACLERWAEARRQWAERRKAVAALGAIAEHAPGTKRPRE